MSWDYSLFSKSVVPSENLSSIGGSLLVSAHNDSDRVNQVWTSSSFGARAWIRHPEYGVALELLPPSDFVHEGGEGEGEIDFWVRFLQSDFIARYSPADKLVFDITGMLRPHVVALPLALALHGYEKATILYSDPVAYVSGSDTAFSLGPVLRTAPVNGFEGVHSTAIDPDDLLIIGAGYDDDLIRAVAEYKRAAEQLVVVGLPSLQPQMYQESVLRIYEASESINRYSRRRHLYAPANDPFMTAGVIADCVKEARLRRPNLNIYLCPLGPKTQALGFSWYYLCEATNSASSVIFPYSESYSAETSQGLARVHVYELELSCVNTDAYA